MYAAQKYRNQDFLDVPVIDLTSDKPTAIPLAIHLQSLPRILNSFPSPIFLDNFQNSELSAASYSPVPPEDNTSYDEIYQTLEHLIESIGSSSPCL